MAKEYSRTRRIADQMQKDLSIIIQQEIKDPRVGIVTVSEVKVSKDLGYADVYFTCMSLNDDAEARVTSEKVLNGASGFLRTLLASAIKLRVMPLLRFHYDPLLGSATHMDRLIKAAVGPNTKAVDDGENENP